MSSESSEQPDIGVVREDVFRLIKTTLNDPNLPEYFKAQLKAALNRDLGSLGDSSREVSSAKLQEWAD